MIKGAIINIMELQTRHTVVEEVILLERITAANILPVVTDLIVVRLDTNVRVMAICVHRVLQILTFPSY